MEKIIEFAKSEMSAQNGHSFDHAKRVYDLCEKILQSVGADRKTVLASALLHDTVDHKFYKDPAHQYAKIRNLLTQDNYTAAEIERIEWLLDNTSFSKNKDLSTNKEAQVLSDADKLDAIGAIGLIRTIQFNAAKGIAFEKDENETKFFAAMYKSKNLEEQIKDLPALSNNESPLFHIHRKLLRIPERLYTDFAKQEAKRRIEFLLAFLEEYYREHNLL